MTEVDLLHALYFRHIDYGIHGGLGTCNSICMTFPMGKLITNSEHNCTGFSRVIHAGKKAFAQRYTSFNLWGRYLRFSFVHQKEPELEDKPSVDRASRGLSGPGLKHFAPFPQPPSSISRLQSPKISGPQRNKHGFFTTFCICKGLETQGP